MKRLFILLLVLFATSSVSTPLIKNPDGSTTINTTSLKAAEGCFGPTPLIIHIDSNGVVSKIEALPNDETPEYWEKAVKGLSKVFKGESAREIKEMKVDAVSGATYSSEGYISNVKAGVDCYLGY